MERSHSVVVTTRIVLVIAAIVHLWMIDGHVSSHLLFPSIPAGSTRAMPHAVSPTVARPGHGTPSTAEVAPHDGCTCVESPPDAGASTVPVTPRPAVDPALRPSPTSNQRPGFPGPARRSPVAERVVLLT